MHIVILLTRNHIGTPSQVVADTGRPMIQHWDARRTLDSRYSSETGDSRELQRTHTRPALSSGFKCIARRTQALSAA